MEALLDKRISQASNRRATVDEVLALAERYRTRYSGWNARHFHSHHRRAGGTRNEKGATALTVTPWFFWWAMKDSNLQPPD
jgi:hypothetical protein